ncbi:DNA polymerase III subunit delta' [Metabacillus sp. GX 13764]|uniref:DNA polymerase III subunit delta' n=1 Tax=Metabacillus kandeliae TaxID=2900151 RepID=UPI001E3E6B4B|nr:DNA polymerase III subunit delta' [Metabacillus kandeliae]MCD7036626.1 DNA polymerase III subunit delta' [Metabacillus kandeliae]
MNKTWDELAGYQPRVLKLLANSISKKRLAHAYLFEGKKGTGKKEVSLLLAKSTFCENLDGFKPCGHCRNCRRIDSGNHPDVHYIEPDGLSIKKKQIQELQEEFSKTGVESNKKVYIISQADKMTVNAANSLLKFLEEPNRETMALLLTEQVHQILNTILSRCQTLSFHPLPSQTIRNELVKSGVPLHLAGIASQLTNNLEDAIELSRNDWFAEARSKVIKLYEALLSRKDQAIIYVHTQWMPFFTDKDLQERGLDLLLYLYKDVISIQVGQEDAAVYKDQMESLRQHALQITQQSAAGHIETILEAKKKLQSNVNPQLLMEQLVLTLQEG